MGSCSFFSSRNKTPRGRCNIILWNWTSIPHVILLHTQHLFWNKMAFGWSLRNYSGKYPVQNDRNNWLRREHKSFILNKWNRSPKGEWVFRNNKQGRLSLFNRNIPCVKFFFLQEHGFLTRMLCNLMGKLLCASNIVIFALQDFQGILLWCIGYCTVWHEFCIWKRRL